MPEPTWVSDCGTVVLYNSDCLEVLPTLARGSVDAVVTSPPYNTLPTSGKASGLHGDRRSGVNVWIDRAVRMGYEDHRPEHEYQAWMLDVFSACFEPCDGIVWINHKIRYRDGEAIHPARMFPWPIYTEVIWDRGGSMALNCRRYAPSTEHLIGFGKPKVWNDHLNSLMSVWRMPFDRDNNDHPCAFPIELARRPIESSTPDNGTVLDPFMGSGTTGVAAVRTGRCFVGIEIDTKNGYFEIAKRRIIDALRTRSETFETMRPKVEPIQLTLLGGDDA